MADDPKRELYQLQEGILVQLQNIGDPQFSSAKLCGGTALDRCWLGHRLSYDLDFFLPQGFGAGKLAVALKKAGVEYETTDIVDSLDRANQLHGYVLQGARRLKVSFVEDAYFDLFPPITSPFGGVTVRTECVEGLYHRKLRTVSGHASHGDPVEGGRQKARNVFDLYVLSRKVMPIRPFIVLLPYAFPAAAFENGLVSMPWFDLVDELAQIICDPEWEQARDIEFLQNALYLEIGANVVLEDDPDAAL